MNFIDHHFTKNLGARPTFGHSQAHSKTMKRQIALCEEHLDMLTWDDLFQVIPQANANPDSDGFVQMEDLVTRLKDNNNASANKMLKLLRRLGLTIANG